MSLFIFNDEGIHFTVIFPWLNYLTKYSFLIFFILSGTTRPKKYFICDKFFAYLSCLFVLFIYCINLFFVNLFYFISVYFFVYFADIDECEEYGICSQICINTIGSYKCSCHQNYTLQLDGKSCKAKGKLKFCNLWENICTKLWWLHLHETNDEHHRINILQFSPKKLWSTFNSDKQF